MFEALENPALVPGDNTLTEPVSCLGDLNGNGRVGSADLLELLDRWGEAGPADLDGSGTVDAGDLLLLLAAWEPCP
ncbi:MAG: hypothetical protein SYC29_09395 [Planctomycetota bacterium]|nr:hypothetical protein [Planctomycetota bacterium]